MAHAPDPEKLKSYLGLIFGSLGGAMTSAMICLGDRLGLYAVLAGRESVNSAELAAATGLKERWLREWLFAQAAAGVLEHRGEERIERVRRHRAPFDHGLHSLHVLTERGEHRDEVADDAKAGTCQLDDQRQTDVADADDERNADPKGGR
jgi:hypothetical protein